MYDWLKDLWNSFLDIWLPSKWPRLVATTAVGLEIALLTLSQWGPYIGITPTEPQMSVIRKMVSPWLFLFALALIHYLVLREKNTSLLLPPWKLHDKITIAVGGYYDILDKDKNKILRITLKKISEQQMPPPYEWPSGQPPLDFKSETATFSFDPQFVYHGSCVKKIDSDPLSDERLLAMGKINYEEVNCSAYFFRTQYATEKEIFFRCFVDHVNPAKQEVELNIYFLSINAK